MVGFVTLSEGERPNIVRDRDLCAVRPVGPGAEERRKFTRCMPNWVGGVSLFHNEQCSDNHRDN